MKQSFLKIILLFLSAVTAVLLSGCAPPPMVPSSGDSYTVTDDTGRTVTIPHRPVRIVSISYGIDEILYDMVDTRRIRAFCRYAGDEDITFITKADRDQVGRTVEDNLESILAESPDLVFVTAGTGRDMIQSLTDMGVPVYVSIYPKTWHDLETKIRGIAAAVDEKDRGEAMIRAMEEKRAVVRWKLSAIPEGKERSALALSFSGAVGKRGTLLADLMQEARIQNKALLLPVSGEAAVFTKENMIEADPDVLILPTWNFNGKSDAGHFKEELLSDPAYANLKAIRTGNLVFVADKYRYVSSQHAAESLEVLAKAVYPELWE